MSDIIVSKELLDRLRLMELARDRLAEQLLTLEQDKLQILGASRRLEEDKNKTFMDIVKEHNLPDDARFEIDRATGKLNLVEHPKNA